MIFWVFAAMSAVSLASYLLGCSNGSKDERLRWYILLSSLDITAEWDCTDYSGFARNVMIHDWPEYEGDEDEEPIS
jgi:hypothetical protein